MMLPILFAAALLGEPVPHIKPVLTPFWGSMLYLPNDGEKHPGVLLLHGSGGGLRSGTIREAQAMAANGYAALAFCYAGCLSATDRDVFRPNLETLHVDLEQTAAALKWLAASAYVGDGKKVALYGVSRGAEQALLVASLLADDPAARKPDAVAVHAPSDVVVGGWNWYWRDDVCLGKSTGGTWNPLCGAAPPAADEPWPQAWVWRKNPDLVAIDRTIPVEKITVPVFISHGELDQVWSADRTHHIVAQRAAAGLTTDAHIFPGQGHGFQTAQDFERISMLYDFFARNLGGATAPRNAPIAHRDERIEPPRSQAW